MTCPFGQQLLMQYMEDPLTPADWSFQLHDQTVIKRGNNNDDDYNSFIKHIPLFSKKASIFSSLVAGCRGCNLFVFQAQDDC